jgi:hypothetical protein
VLHLLNGDATLAVFPSTLPGHHGVWRDIMVEGPAIDDGAARAVWLAPRLGVTPEEYERGWRQGQALLARAGGADEVVLWFEQDLFCAVNLWFIVARLPPTTPLWLVFPPLNHSCAGLGALATSELTELFESRRRLDGDARREADALWRAYAASDPTGVARTRSSLAFADEAIRLHLGRFPSADNGLNEIETATLHALVPGPQLFGALFRAVTHAPAHRRHGMGDVQYAAVLRELQPLIALEGDTTPFSRWRVILTQHGAHVLEGRLDGLAARTLDRWLGGVHLQSSEPGWRWDGARMVRP